MKEIELEEKLYNEKITHPTKKIRKIDTKNEFPPILPNDNPVLNLCKNAQQKKSLFLRKRKSPSNATSAS